MIVWFGWFRNLPDWNLKMFAEHYFKFLYSNHHTNDTASWYVMIETESVGDLAYVAKKNKKNRSFFKYKNISLLRQCSSAG
jgi:hypothetical protein